MTAASLPPVKTQKLTVRFDAARQAAARERWTALARGSLPERPFFTFNPAGGPAGAKPDRLALDDRLALEVKVAGLNHHLAEFTEDDFLPCFHNCDLGQAIVPSLFGAGVIVEETQPPYTEGRLIQDLERDLPKLKRRIDPEADGWGPRLKRRIQTLLEGTDYRIPVVVTDHQSPYGVATKLVGNEELMLAMYEAPQAVHELMAIATQAIADLLRAQQRWAGDPALMLLNPAMPVPGAGLILWDDYISVISPQLHREFCQPYNEQLYREFGRGHLHTCGPYFTGYLDAALAHPSVRTIDISAYLRGTSRTRADLLRLREASRAAGVMLCGGLHAWEVVGAGTPLPPDREFLRQMADGGLLWNEGGPREKGLEYLGWLREAGWR